MEPQIHADKIKGSTNVQLRVAATSIAAFLLCSAIVVDAFAFSPRIWEGCKIIAFAPNSAEMSNAVKVELVRVSPDLMALHLAYLAVTAWSDTSEGKSGGSRQRLLAERRAEAIKQFYFDAGIDERLVSWEGRLAEKRLTPNPATFAPDGSRIDSVKVAAGVAAVRYGGACREGHEAVCVEMRDHCGWRQ
jgi:hypothetical protein